jgi:hypothetical protein
MAGESDNRNSVSNTAKTKIEAIRKFRKFQGIPTRDYGRRCAHGTFDESDPIGLARFCYASVGNFQSSTQLRDSQRVGLGSRKTQTISACGSSRRRLLGQCGNGSVRGNL